MSHGKELKSPAAQELRRKGYVPLPRWWVRREDLQYIERIAEIHAPEVNRIRDKHRRRSED